MAVIPAGEFQMGENFAAHSFLSKWAGSSELVHPVYLDSFFIDKYEVTNAQWQKFLEANPAWQPPNGQMVRRWYGGGWNYDYVSKSYLGHWDGMNYPEGEADHPVVVSWYAAAAYAQFYGKRLPTEAEWEKAARGGLVGKRYPWGDDISHDDANFATDCGHRYADGWGMRVGSFPPNGYGLYDMAGNVAEWCADAYQKDYYSRSPYKNPSNAGGNDFCEVYARIDRGLITQYRVCRGASADLCYDLDSGGVDEIDLTYLRCASRGFAAVARNSLNVGFRCAQDGDVKTVVKDNRASGQSSE